MGHSLRGILISFFLAGMLLAGPPVFIGPRYVAISFTGEKCVHCKTLEKIWRTEKVRGMRERLGLIRYIVDDRPDQKPTFTKWGVTILPTTILVRTDGSGKIVSVLGRSEGATSETGLIEFVERQVESYEAEHGPDPMKSPP